MAGRRYTGAFLALVLAALAVGASASLASAASPAARLQGEVVSGEPVELDGRLRTDPSPGIVHARTSHVDGLQASLSASSLRLSYTWESGERVKATPEGDDVARVIHDQGQETEHLENASVSIEGLRASPEVLVDATPSSLDPTVEGIGQGSVDVTGVLSETLTSVEYSDNATSVGETPGRHGFEYAVDTPRVSVSGLDEVTVRGSFAVFVNNVTLEGSGMGEDLEHWTGYRERTVGSATTFESRVTLLQVEDATLTLAAPSGIGFVSESIPGHFAGHVNASQAVGTLATAATEYAWDGDEMSLDGSGRLNLGVKPSLDAFAAMSDGSASQLPVEMGADGQFNVERTQDLSVTSQTPVQAGSSQASWWWLVPLAAAGTVAFLGRHKLGAKLDCARAELRERRVQSWMQTGDRLTSVREFERALKWYDRTTETYPNHAEAWYAKGSCLAEVDDHAAAAEAYAEANELLGGDDPQLLDMAATEAWNAGREELAMEWFEELADVEPHRFLQRIQDPGYQELREQPRIQACLDEMDPDTSPSVV